jgi:hypothetical protein
VWEVRRVTERMQEAFEERSEVAEAIAADTAAPGLDAVDSPDDGLTPVFQSPAQPASRS